MVWLLASMSALSALGYFLSERLFMLYSCEFHSHDVNRL